MVERGLMRKNAGTALAWVAVCMLAVTGCVGKGRDNTVQITAGLENYGNISVITREDGSGTRNAFAEQVDLLSENAGSTSDLITKSAEVAINAEAVLEAVGQNRTAIGFVSSGAVTAEADGIKAINISGIQPSPENVGNGTYPLCRDFNIAYSGSLSPVEHDFITYIMSKGQDIVKENYTPIKQAAVFLSDQSAGAIEVTGSTSVAPLMEKLAEDYERINKNAEIEIKASDSTSGMTSAMQGSCDIGMASRDLKDYEKELLTYETIARDGITIIVNKDNPVASLTISQLTDIFSGKDTMWNDINK